MPNLNENEDIFIEVQEAFSRLNRCLQKNIAVNIEERDFSEKACSWEKEYLSGFLKIAEDAIKEVETYNKEKEKELDAILADADRQFTFTAVKNGEIVSETKIFPRSSSDAFLSSQYQMWLKTINANTWERET